MAITKTDFIELTKCKRYSYLEEIRKDKLTSDMTLEEYMKEEENNSVNELISSMFNEEDVDLTKKVDKQLTALLDYYKEVEINAGLLSTKIFGGESKYSLDTYNQESFSFTKNGIKYLCFVDIFNESNEDINIIEVKATTSSKYKKMEYIIDKNKYPLFNKKNNIYYLEKDPKISRNYQDKINKLLNRYSEEGKYFFDIAIQRYFIEGYLKENNINKKVNYYLATLNSDYTYDGLVIDGKRVYKNDSEGNELIDFIDANEITSLYMKIIDNYRLELEKCLFFDDIPPVVFGPFCALKKRSECKFKMICYSHVPLVNASYNYMNFRSFKINDETMDKYDLLNNGYYKLDDIPKESLVNVNHIIQRNCYDNNEIYVNKEKIKAGLNSLKYPIYHLDFETLPCPVPRFKGEHPYSQSVFEFSLHIEREEGICDLENDNYVFLAKSLEDERENLVKALVKWIPIYETGGTMLAQNVDFEKSRIKELSILFPEYKNELMAIYNSGRDLLEIIENNKELYSSLGFENEEVNKVNYYNNNQSGSYSIKKTLPLFTNLSYKTLDIQNGTDALSEYARYDKMDDEERNKVYEALRVYCRQDTWAMVEILRGLRKLIM